MICLLKHFSNFCYQKGQKGKKKRKEIDFCSATLFFYSRGRAFSFLDISLSFRFKGLFQNHFAVFLGNVTFPRRASTLCLKYTSAANAPRHWYNRDSVEVISRKAVCWGLSEPNRKSMLMGDSVYKLKQKYFCNLDIQYCIFLNIFYLCVCVYWCVCMHVGLCVNVYVCVCTCTLVSAYNRIYVEVRG